MNKYLLPLVLILLLFTVACSHKVSGELTEIPQRCTEIVELDSIKLSDSLKAAHLQDSQKMLVDTALIFRGDGPHCHPWMPYCFSTLCPCCDVCIIPEKPIVWPKDWGKLVYFCGLSNLYIIAPEDQLMNHPPIKYYTIGTKLQSNLNTWTQVGINYQPIISAYWGYKGYIKK